MLAGEVRGEVASRHNGKKSCQCRLTVEIEGELVSTCAGLELQRAQRSVSLGGFPAAQLKNMFFNALGYRRNDEGDCAEVAMMAEKLDAKDASAGRNYLISVAHFPPKQLYFTDKQVRFSRKTALGTTDYTAVYPGVPAAVVHARAQAIRAGMPPAEALALQLPAAPARLSPGGRVSRGGKRLVEELCGVALVDGALVGGRALDDGSPTHAVPKLARPPGASSIGTGKREKFARSLLGQLDGGRAAEKEVKRLEGEFEAAAERSGDLAAELADTKAQVRALTEKLAEVNLEKDRLAAAAVGDARALRDALARCARANDAHEAALKQVAAARAAHADFTPWRTRMLANTRGLGKLVRELTTFRSLSAFKTFFDVALDGQGCTRAGWAGQAARLDYWYAPKHNGSASAAASARAPTDGGKWPQQLNPLKPGGLDSPFEACFLTMATLRLGLRVDDAAVLFGISSGSASSIFNTWVPFISRALTGITPWPDGATVAANLPRKFKEKLARTTHSKRCRIIIDCTEFEIQVPNDDNMRKLY